MGLAAGLYLGQGVLGPRQGIPAVRGTQKGVGSLVLSQRTMGLIKLGILEFLIVQGTQKNLKILDVPGQPQPVKGILVVGGFIQVGGHWQIGPLTGDT